MKAVILAAGKGKRMGELTDNLPKPMVPVHGKPVLQHIIERIRDHSSIRDFFVITGHCAETIENHFLDGSKWGIRCSYGRQEVPDGTGKAPEIAKAWVAASPFLLSYGDILIDGQEYAGMEKAFAEDALLSVKKVAQNEIAQGGAVVLDGEGFVTDLIEKAAPGTVNTPWYNAGVYVFRPDVFTYTGRLEKSPRGEYELTDAIRAMAGDGKKIRAHELRGNWVDVRDQQVLSRLNQTA